MKNKNSKSNISITSHRKNRIRVDESGIEIPSINDNDKNIPVTNNSALAYYFNNSSSSSSSSSNININSNISNMKKMKRMKNINHVMDHCTQEYWNENLISNGGTLQFQKKWSYNINELKNKTVSFRLVESNNNCRYYFIYYYNRINSYIYTYIFLLLLFFIIEFYFEKKQASMCMN